MLSLHCWLIRYLAQIQNKKHCIYSEKYCTVLHSFANFKQTNPANEQQANHRNKTRVSRHGLKDIGSEAKPIVLDFEDDISLHGAAPGLGRAGNTIGPQQRSTDQAGPGSSGTSAPCAKAKGQAKATAAATQKIRKLQPSVAATRLRTKTMKLFSDFKTLLGRAVTQAEFAKSQLSAEDLSIDDDPDPVLKLIIARLELVQLLRQTSQASLDVDQLTKLTEEDVYFQEVGVLLENLKSVGQLEHMRAVQAALQSTTQGVISVFDQHSEAIAAGSHCANALLLVYH